MAATRSRHHGNLREALIEASIALLAEVGPGALTLRKAAARAGVSHAAPAHHFDGLPGLLAKIALRGFEMFHAHLDQRCKAETSDAPFAQLMAANSAYVEFARCHRALFQLMFVEVEHSTPPLRLAAMRCYGVLQEKCRPLCGDRDPAAFESAVWALTHGYVALGMAEPRPNAPAQVPSYETLLRMLVRPEGEPAR